VTPDIVYLKKPFWAFLGGRAVRGLRFGSPQKAKNSTNKKLLQGLSKCLTAPLQKPFVCAVGVAFFPHPNTAVIVLWWGRWCVVAVYPRPQTRSGGRNREKKQVFFASFLALCPPSRIISVSLFYQASRSSARAEQVPNGTLAKLRNS
jgi:hypothetical protein